MRSHAGQVAFPGGAVDPGDDGRRSRRRCARRWRRPGSTRPASTSRRRCRRCSCRRAASSSRRCSAGGASRRRCRWWTRARWRRCTGCRWPSCSTRRTGCQCRHPSGYVGAGVRRRRAAGVGLHRRAARPDAAAGRLGAAVGRGPTCEDLPARDARATDADRAGSDAWTGAGELARHRAAACRRSPSRFSGYRQGFVVGVLAFAGFLGGGVIGLLLAPRLVRRSSPGSGSRCSPSAIVLLAATIGQVALGLARRVVRDRITWRPARVVDAGARRARSASSRCWWSRGSWRRRCGPGRCRRCRARSATRGSSPPSTR